MSGGEEKMEKVVRCQHLGDCGGFCGDNGFKIKEKEKGKSKGIIDVIIKVGFGF